MDEEKFNLSVRKFLKNFGITSQRLIEKKVGGYVSNNKKNKSHKIKISATLISDEINLNEKVDGELEIEI